MEHIHCKKNEFKFKCVDRILDLKAEKNIWSDAKQATSPAMKGLDYLGSEIHTYNMQGVKDTLLQLKQV